MPYTTPTTFTTSTILSAATLNAQLRDNMDWLATAKPTCRAKRTSVQSISNATFTAVLFDAEDWDSAAMHSTSSNTSRITIPSGGSGKYELGWSGYWAINTTGRRVASLRKNGFAGTIVTEVEMPTNATGVSSGTLSMVDNAVAGDYYEIYIFQNSGGSLNLDCVSLISYFWAKWYST